MSHRKNMNDLEKDPEKYIEQLFSFLENEGFLILKQPAKLRL